MQKLGLILMLVSVVLGVVFLLWGVVDSTERVLAVAGSVLIAGVVIGGRRD